MKIGYLIPEFPGQTHIFFWREIKAIKSMGMEIDLISTKLPPSKIISHSWSKEAQEKTTYLFPPNEYFGAILLELLRCGVKGWFKCFKSILQAKQISLYERLRLLAFVFIGAELSYLARKHEWQHIHVHSCANSANIAMFAFLLSGLTYSLTLHGPLSDYGSNQEQKWKYATFAIVITQKLYDEVKKTLDGYLPKHLGIAPMGVDPSVFQRTIPYQPWETQKTCHIFSCGRLNPCKGHADLIEAIAMVKQEGIDIELKIAGEDEQGGEGYHKQLDKLVQELNLEKSVHLLGAVSEEKVRQYLEEAHIFALASWKEPLGVAIMEAMMMEVPIIVTGEGGVKELVDHEVNGLLVSPKSPKLLAQAIKKLLNNPQLSCALSKAGRNKVIRDFSSEKSAKMIMEFLNKS
ncbi:MAG: glycosyltransferase family 4 protein [Crocosphaera sp.]|nr:glycosyltransferase family 4 protein [Crocosphaera sp.]